MAKKTVMQLSPYDTDVCCPKCSHELCWSRFNDADHLRRYGTWCGFRRLERCSDDELEKPDRIQVGGWGFPREVAEQIEKKIV